MLIAALFAIDKKWGGGIQALIIEKWIKKMWAIYIMELYSITKQLDLCLVICLNMEGTEDQCIK